MSVAREWVLRRSRCPAQSITGQLVSLPDDSDAGKQSSRNSVIHEAQVSSSIRSLALSPLPMRVYAFIYSFVYLFIHL